MMRILIIVLALTIVSFSCTSDADFEKGKAILEGQRYSGVVNTGYSAFCCSDEDTYSTGFTATDKNGNAVHGCFCSSLLKGITIRFE